jgi:hypothetical protein
MAPDRESITAREGSTNSDRLGEDGVLPEPPSSGYATAGAVADFAGELPPAPPGETASEVLFRMREDER